MQNYHVIGLMSGTSLDGLDLAYCRFYQEHENWSYQLLTHRSLPYSSTWQKRLKESVEIPPMDLLELHVDYGAWLGEQTKKFMEEEKLEPDFIASHGHTVYHQPQRRFTCQIGAGQEIANICDKPVVSDFRSQDVLLGGQGAPLVPIGDRDLFGAYDFCLNLGGIANVSLEWKGERIAYDISPANMLLNHIVRQTGQEYDAGGRLARSGVLYPDLLAALNQLPYYQLSHPKSLGYEWFVEQVIPLLKRSTIPLQDQLHTAVLHIAQMLARDLISFATAGKQKLLCTGGGAKNDFLMETLQEALQAHQIEVVIPSEELIDFKEAIVFAFMGVKRWQKEVNCLASVTGASRDSSGGVIHRPI